MAVITLTGPTCAGKSTVERELQKLGCGRAVSHTTRRPRSGEVDGDQYHFVTDAEFDRANAAGEFIETIEFGSKRYAMAAASLEKAHRDSQNVVIVVEPVGAAQILSYCKQHGLKTLAVWLDCHPDVQARRWVSRLASDMVVGKEVIGAYGERLGIMLDQEVKWRAAAYGGNVWSSAWGYDLMLHRTDMHTPQFLAERIFNQLVPAVA